MGSGGHSVHYMHRVQCIRWQKKLGTEDLQYILFFFPPVPIPLLPCMIQTQRRELGWDQLRFLMYLGGIFRIPGWDFWSTWVGLLSYLGGIIEIPGLDYWGTWVGLLRYLGGIIEEPGWDLWGTVPGLDFLVTRVGLLKYLGGTFDVPGLEY